MLRWCNGFCSSVWRPNIYVWSCFICFSLYEHRWTWNEKEIRNSKGRIFLRKKTYKFIDKITFSVKSDTVHHNCNFFNVALGGHNRFKVFTKLNLDLYESMIFFSLGYSEIKVHIFWEGHEILGNHPLWCSLVIQKKSVVSQTFCGLLTKPQFYTCKKVQMRFQNNIGSAVSTAGQLYSSTITFWHCQAKTISAPRSFLGQLFREKKNEKRERWLLPHIIAWLIFLLRG